MSHITKVETRIIDKEILLATLSELGHDYEEMRAIHFEGRSVPVNVAVWKKGGFRIGFSRRGDDDVYEMHSFGVSLGEAKAFHDKLHQRYARRKLLKEAERQNFVLIQEKVFKDNRIRLVLRKVA